MSNWLQIPLSFDEMKELPASEVDNLCNILYTEWPQSIPVST